MTPITTLQPVLHVRDQVRSNALQSLEFMANTVLGLSLDESVCRYAEDAINDSEKVLLHTKRVKALAIAIVAWLEARGVKVMSEISVPEHEILEWLCLTYKDSQEKEDSICCMIEMQKEGVLLTWL